MGGSSNNPGGMLQGMGPVSSGSAYGSFLDSGGGPFASGEQYGSLVDSFGGNLLNIAGETGAKTFGKNAGDGLWKMLIGGVVGGMGKGIMGNIQQDKANKPYMAALDARYRRTGSQKRVGSQLGQRLESRLGGLKPIQPVNRRLVQRRIG